MRKATLILVALVALAASPAFAQFENYHYSANINCSDCHSMHASAHNNLTDGTAITASATTPSQAINPYYPTQGPLVQGRHYLLKNDDVCASCHDGKSWAPDVIGANDGNGATPYVRSAGGVKASTAITSGGGHQIGSVNRPPGYNGALVGNYFDTGSKLECFSCHSPHGSATAFRNLGPYQMRTTIGASASAVLPTVAKAALFDNTKDVTVAAATRTWGADLHLYYGNDKVKYGRAADGAEIAFGTVKASNRYDHFCGVCHGNFHGGVIGASPVADITGFIKHPTSIKLLSEANNTGVWGTSKGADTLKVYTVDGASAVTTSSPGCVSCHKAHGNNNPFALIYPDRGKATPAGLSAVTYPPYAGGSATTEEGIGTYKDLCKSCHSMGGY